MKTGFIARAAVFAFSVSLLSAQFACAQPSLYLSNLGAPATGSFPVANDSWIAIPFVSGANPGGYALNSVQFALANASGSPAGITVEFLEGDLQNSLFENLTIIPMNGAANPVTSGVFTYTPSASVILSPSQEYFLILTGATAMADGAYNQDYAALGSYQQNGG